MEIVNAHWECVCRTPEECGEGMKKLTRRDHKNFKSRFSITHFDDDSGKGLKEGLQLHEDFVVITRDAIKNEWEGNKLS